MYQIQQQIGNVSLFSKHTIQEYFLLYPLTNEETHFESIVNDNSTIQEIQGNTTVDETIEKSQLFIDGNLVCNGPIEKSTIVCLGDVTINGTVNECSLFVRGTINCNSISNSIVINEHDVFVKNEVRKSEITSGGNFDGIRAVIQGSKVVVCENIIVEKVSKPTEFTQTSLIAGDKRLFREKIVQQKTKLTDFEQKIVSTKQAIEHIVKRMIQLNKLTMKFPLLDDLKLTLRQLEEKVANQKELVALLLEQNNFPRKENFIQINSSFSDGIFIEISGTKFISIASESGVRFKTDGENVYSLPIKQLL